MEALEQHPEVKNVLQKITEAEEIYDYAITDFTTNAKGEGFLGDVSMVTIKDNKSEKSLHLVIKRAFQGEKIRGYVPIRMTYENEIYFYSKVGPEFKKIGGEFCDFIAKCYGTSLSNAKEVLVLENLKVQGFEVFDKKLDLDHEHVKLIFETYGKFHASSLVLSQKNPDGFEQITSGILNVLEAFLPVFEEHFIKSSGVIRNSLVEGDGRIINDFKKYEGKNIMQTFSDSLKESKYSTILHGDCWSNNIMFKYRNVDNSSRKPVAIRLLDFQLIKTGSPVCDLSYCLYSGGSKVVFDKLDEYLTIYRDSFVSFVRQLGGDPENVFSFEELKEEWKTFSKFGFIMSLSIWQIKYTGQEDIVDLTDFSELHESKGSHDGFKYDKVRFINKVREILEHLLEIEAL